jgi:hypothetical protein
MEALLKFNMDNPDDQMAHLRCVKSLDMALVIWEFIRNSRKKLEDREFKDSYEAIEATYERFFELLEEHDINIDKLTY